MVLLKVIVLVYMELVMMVQLLAWKEYELDEALEWPKV
jgi:hypothetical protein